MIHPLTLSLFKPDELDKVRAEKLASQYEKKDFLKFKEPKKTKDGIIVYSYAVKFLNEPSEKRTQFNEEGQTTPIGDVQLVATDDPESELKQYGYAASNVDLKQKTRTMMKEKLIGRIFQFRNLGSQKGKKFMVFDITEIKQMDWDALGEVERVLIEVRGKQGKKTLVQVKTRA